jgi:hypothetical protein
MSPDDLRQVLAALNETPEFRWLRRKMEEEQALHGRQAQHAPADASDLDDLLDKHGQRPGTDASLEKYHARLSDRAIGIATAALADGRRLEYDEAVQLARKELGPPPESQPERYSLAVETKALQIHAAEKRRGRFLSYTDALQAARKQLGLAPPRVEKFTMKANGENDGRLNELAVEIASQASSVGHVMSYDEAITAAKTKLGRAA